MKFNNYSNIGFGCGTIVGWFIIMIILGILCVFPIMWLWNWLVPSLFNGPEITFWQTVGLYFLINLLIRTNLSLNINTK